MERLKRYNKKILAFVSAFVVLVGGVLSTSSLTLIDVCASDTKIQERGFEFYANYAEPSVSDTSGYVNLLLNGSGGYTVLTFYWTMHGKNANTNATTSLSGMFTLTNTMLKFGGYGDYDTTDYYYCLYEFNANGDCRVKYTSSSAGGYTQTFINGTTIVGYKAYGNTVVSADFLNQPNFTVYYTTDGSAELLMDILEVLNYDKLSDDWIRSTLHSILNNTEGIKNQLSACVSYLKSVDSHLTDIEDELDDIYDKADEILGEQKKTNTWLEKIWNSIQEFFNPSDEEKTDSEQFDSETTEKSDEIGGLVEDSKTEKPDVEDMSNSIDSNLDMTSANEYGAVLLNITENEYILQMLLIVVTVAIIAYVLFGKR